MFMSVAMVEFFFCGFPHTHDLNIKIQCDPGERMIQVNRDFIPLYFFHHNLLRGAIRRFGFKRHAKFNGLDFRLNQGLLREDCVPDLLALRVTRLFFQLCALSSRSRLTQYEFRLSP